MSKDTKPVQKRIDQFLSGPGGRADDWRDLREAAKAWARGGDRANYDVALADHIPARAVRPRWKSRAPCPVGYAVSGILLTVFGYFAMLLAQ
jgi:hypothetical protein